MAMAWDPEWAVATSDDFRDALSESGEAGTFLGQVTYFSRRRGPLPPLPPPVQVEPVEDKGSLLLLSPERLKASNPEHVNLARAMAAPLTQAGLLRPLQPWEG
jgi:hypothetical protein